MTDLDSIAEAALQRLEKGRRVVVALAGPPCAGKTTASEQLVRLLDERAGEAVSAIVPMDGYHYDNQVIEPRGLLARKGAPETFDIDSYRNTLMRLRDTPGEAIAVPVFDRELDLARAGARLVEPSHRAIVTEGNYLLLDRAPWLSLRQLFDLTVFLTAPEPILLERFIARWLDHDHTPAQAEARARSNDLPNAQLVLGHSARADFTVDTSSAT